MCENKYPGVCIPTHSYRFYLSFEDYFCEEYFTEYIKYSYKNMFLSKIGFWKNFHTNSIFIQIAI